VSAALRIHSIERNGPYQLKEHIYSVEPKESLVIGKRSLGNISNYYTGEVISDEEVAAVQAAAEKYDVNVMNTRYVVHLRRALGLNCARVHKNSSSEFILKVASSEDQPSANAEHDIEVGGNKVNLSIRYGDFRETLTRSIEALTEVRHFSLILGAGLPDRSQGQKIYGQ
jgi:dipeptidyl-peptidase III